MRKPTRRAGWVLAILLIFLVAFTSYSAVKKEAEAQRLIRSALLDGKFSQAASLIEKEMAGAEERDFYLYLLGNARFLEDKFTEAASAFERLEEEFPESKWAKKARFRRAACLGKLKDWKSAEEIYEKDVSYLVSPERKDEIASIYLDIAERYFNPPKEEEKPNYNKAYKFYKLALGIGLNVERREKILFLAAKSIKRAKNYQQAIKDFQVFLKEYPEGKFAAEARYLLGHSYFSINNHLQARRVWQDLVRLLPEDKFAADAAYKISRTYRIPNPPNARELELGVSALERFMEKYPQDERVPRAHFEIALSYYNRRRLDDAARAFASFLAQYKGKELEEIPRAKYLLGHTYLRQKKYDDAVEIWQDYVTHHPAGADWNAAQRGVIEIDYSIGADFLAEKKYAQARGAWEKFLSKNPLHPKAAEIMFKFGQMEFDQERFDAAIDEWRKVVSKYPGREESSRAQFMIAETCESKIYELTRALDEYKKVTWGSWKPRAQERIRQMKAPHLEVLTERTFRSNEPALIKVTTRNLDRIKVKVYPLDLGAYFRKMHHTGGVEFLDIGLVNPEETWEISVKDFEKYRLIEEEIEIPIDGQGTVAVTVCGLEPEADEAELEATTLVIKSDLDIILKVSKRQVFVFAENMLTRKPFPGATILFSNGKEIFCEGKTGDDGIFSKENETLALEELKDASSIRAFAYDERTSAASLVGLEGLRFGIGFSPRGYIYTDRPAYRPGQEVNIRAIVRLSDGKSYTYKPDQEYLLEIQDPQGRILTTETVALSDFGTISSKFQLDELAPVGTYKVLLRYTPGKPASPAGGEVFSGQFLVKRYKLEPVKVEIELPRRVYFRGEKVEGKIIAKYHYGEPVAGKLVEYYLGDQIRRTATTDKNGEVAFTLETQDFTEERPILISARIPEANVGATETFILAIRAYTARVSTIRNVFLSGEKFEVEIKTRDAKGEKVSREMILKALRREKTPSGMGEVLVTEEKFKTDEKTGKATVVLALVKGGQYILRASGTDRFKNIVTAERTVFISDEEDKTRLRILADRTSLKVGEDFALNIHSHLDENLCLVTFEGDWVIDHRLLTLKKGSNKFKFQVGHNLFPNFALSANVMDGNKLYEARTHFTVDRRLTLAIKPNKDTYEPGEEAEIEITTTDQLGNPVSAEVSLAMVDEALYFLFPDPYRNIRSFFHPGRREAYMRTDSSCVFKYAPRTQEVAKEVLTEAERLRRERKEAAKVAEIRSRARVVAGRVEADEQLERLARATSARGRVVTFANGHVESLAVEVANRLDRDGNGIVDVAITMGDFVRGGGAMVFMMPSAAPGAPPVFGKPREYFPEAAYWNPAVVTDKNGKATVKFPLPDTMTTWRLRSVGVSEKTHLGEMRTSVVVKKDFFVDLKLPAILTEGDEPKILTRIHNSIGPAKLKIKAKATCGDKAVEFSKEIEMKEKGTLEVIFDALRAEGREVVFEVTATNGKNSDYVKRTVPVRPWGMEYIAKKSGTATDDTKVFLALPPGRKYSHQEMRIIIGPTMERMLIDIALDQVPSEAPAGRFVAPGDRNSATAARLLSCLFCRDYIGAAKDEGRIDYRRLEDRIRAAASDLISTQNKDGGWAWVGIKKTSDRYVTSIVFWALAKAKSAGFPIPDQTLEKAEKFLLNQFSRARSEEHEAKAIILHALSAQGKADFAYANRLYRLRNSLSESGLAHLALTFINLERPQMAREILRLFKQKAIHSDEMIYFSGASNDAWMKSNLETTALVVYAMAQVEPKSPDVEKGIKWILAQRSCGRFYPPKALGAVMAALTEYYGQAKFAAARFRLVISVNDKIVKRLETEAASPTKVILVRPELIKDGENKVTINMEGKGEYSYEVLLSAFSPDIRPGSRSKEFWVRRWYEPGHIFFEGREIKRGFAVLAPPRKSWRNPLTQLPLGKLGEVTVDPERYWLREEERARLHDYLVLEEYLPAGTTVLPETIRGNFDYYELGDGVIRFFYRPTVHPGGIYYRIVGYLPGKYRAFPSVLRSMYEPEKVALSHIKELTVLSRGEKSKDKYSMTPDEFYHLGKAYFDKGRKTEAEPLLTQLFKEFSLYPAPYKDTVRMLLKIAIHKDDAPAIVEYFEILKEKYPQIYISFEDIIKIGEAYRKIGEFERALLVFRTTAEMSFILESKVAGNLEAEGKFLAACDFLKKLVLEYPDLPSVEETYFDLSQMYYDKAGKPVVSPELKEAGMDRLELLLGAATILKEYLLLYPQSPAADEASFSLCNAFLDLEDFQEAVSFARVCQRRYKESTYLDSFLYVEALGHFNLGEYDKALEMCQKVAEGKFRDARGALRESENKNLAIYIMAQIYHSSGEPAKAIAEYEKVKEHFADSKEAIHYFQKKAISIPEVTTVVPGDKVVFSIKYRNIPEVELKVYKVDLMKYYLMERSLAQMAEINLAGISPLHQEKVTLGEGKDYVDKEREIRLPLKEEGAYFLLARGGDLFSSGMVLITPLELEIEEDVASGRVRTYIKDAGSGKYKEKVEVKVIGSENKEFVSGKTDLRGIFIADGIVGKVTVIARDEKDKFAFYRGEKFLGERPKVAGVRLRPAAKDKLEVDYMSNIRGQNEMFQLEAIQRRQQFYQQEVRGVQAEQLE